MTDDVDEDEYGEPKNQEQAHAAAERQKFLKREAIRREIERNRASEAEYQEKADEAGKERDEWHRRWSLRLAVVNGAGLVGISTAILNANEKLQALAILPSLLVSAWLFFIGAGLAGSIPFFRARYLHAHSGWLETYASEQGHGGGTVPIYTNDYDEGEPSSYYLKKYGSASRLWKRCTTYSEIIASLTFVLGIAGPLVILSVRVFHG